MMVQRISSLLFHPKEERIPVARDHSEIAKVISPSDSHYSVLVGYLREYMEEIVIRNDQNVEGTLTHYGNPQCQVFKVGY